jgi:hypothetical protein
MSAMLDYLLAGISWGSWLMVPMFSAYTSASKASEKEVVLKPESDGNLLKARFQAALLSLDIDDPASPVPDVRVDNILLSYIDGSWYQLNPDRTIIRRMCNL